MDESSVQLIQQLPERARHMTNLINTFLDAQAIEDGGIRLRRRTIDLVSIAESVLDAHRRDALTRNVELELHAPDSPVSIHADRARVRQILENLVSNAVKFTQRGTVIVRIAPEEGSLAIEVIDSGPGIPDSEQARLFMPYSEISTRAVGGEQSRGLGLSICKFLVELHGGSIEAGNHPDGGAVFTVRLPSE